MEGHQHLSHHLHHQGLIPPEHLHHSSHLTHPQHHHPHHPLPVPVHAHHEQYQDQPMNMVSHHHHAAHQEEHHEQNTQKDTHHQRRGEENPVPEQSESFRNVQHPNPWEVGNIQEFLHYCCPECDFKSKTVPSFQGHAVENHPLSKKFFTEEITVAADPRLYLDGPSGQKIDPVMDKKPEVDVKPFSAMGNMPEHGIIIRAGKEDMAKVAYILQSSEQSQSMSFSQQQSKKKRPGRKVRKRSSAMSDDDYVVEFDDPAVKKERRDSEDHNEDATKSANDNDIDGNGPETDPDYDMKPYSCMMCPEKYNRLYALAVHLMCFHDVGKNGKHPCPACDHVSNTMPKLKSHIIETHEESSNGMPTNPDPGTSSPRKSKRESSGSSAIRSKGGGEDRVIRCEELGCTYETNKRMNFMAHMKYKHSPHLHKEQCDACGKTFLYKSSLQHHKDTVHLKRKKHICERCGKGYYQKNELEQHMRQPKCDVLNRKDLSYSCDACGDEFTHLKGYIVHYKKAHNGFPSNINSDNLELFYCDQCPEVYTREATLKKHKKIVHEGMGHMYTKPKAKPKEKCPYCGKMVNRGVQMTEHVKSKHENDTPFKCDQCTKAFGTNAFLRLHTLQVHRRMKCNICGKEICNKLWFKRHMAKVHGVVAENAIQCDLCTVVFETMDAKSKHMMKQHA